jgi:hypothetical protein
VFVRRSLGTLAAARLPAWYADQLPVAEGTGLIHEMEVSPHRRRAARIREGSPSRVAAGDSDPAGTSYSRSNSRRAAANRASCSAGSLG